jgi:hypothetical protein
MSGVRVLNVEIAVDPSYASWSIMVFCPQNREITPQEVLDAVADALLNEGELDPFSSRNPSQLDS